MIDFISLLIEFQNLQMIKSNYLNQLFLFILFGLLTIISCNKDEPEPTPIPNIVAVKVNLQTYEFTSIIVNVTFQNEYAATFGGETVELVKTSDSTLSFLVPNVGTGNHILEFELGKLEYSITKTEIANAQQVIPSVFTTFDNDMNSLSNDTLVNQQDVTDANTFKSEVAQLYNNLTDIQKQEAALIYEANKELFAVFKADIATVYDAPTFLKNLQSDCPTSSPRDFYDCTADNLGNSTKELIKRSKEFAKWIALAAIVGEVGGSLWYTGPVAAGLTATGLTLSAFAAYYTFTVEVRPAFIKFKANIIPFLNASWILVKEDLFTNVQTEFHSFTEKDLGINAKLRNLEISDIGISNGTDFFISTYGSLKTAWNDFKSIFGELPDYSNHEENTELDNNDVTVSNISNPNVELINQNGKNVTFKSLSPNDENFTFDITVNKNGFTESHQVSAVVKAGCGVPPTISFIKTECINNAFFVEFSYDDIDGPGILLAGNPNIGAVMPVFQYVINPPLPNYWAQTGNAHWLSSHDPVTKTVRIELYMGGASCTQTSTSTNFNSYPHKLYATDICGNMTNEIFFNFDFWD